MPISLKFKLRGAKIKSCGTIINRDRQKSLLEHGSAKKGLVEKQFLTNVFSFFTNVAKISEDLIVIES